MSWEHLEQRLYERLPEEVAKKVKWAVFLGRIVFTLNRSGFVLVFNGSNPIGMTLPLLKQGVSRLHEEGELSPPKAGGGACLSPLRGGSKPTPM